MPVTDGIADLLSRINNAQQRGLKAADIPHSIIKEKILHILGQEGFIERSEILSKGSRKILRVTLRYRRNKVPLISGFRRISRPSCRVYISARDIHPVKAGFGSSVVSTSQGVFSGKEARQKGFGGELLFEIW